MKHIYVTDKPQYRREEAVIWEFLVLLVIGKLSYA